MTEQQGKIPRFVAILATYGIPDSSGIILARTAAQQMVENIRIKGFKVEGKDVQVLSAYLEPFDDPEKGRVIVAWSPAPVWD